MKISLRTSIVSSFVCAVITALLSVSTDGQALDPNFRASVYGGDAFTTTGDVRIIKAQPDGKLLVGGLFSEVQGYGASSLTRISQDGTPDPTFNSPEFYNGVGATSTILAIAVQPDGKILIGGDLAGMGSDNRPGIRRLNADGSIDTGFFIQNVGTFHVINDIKLQADGKILIGGTFAIPNSNLNVARLNADGTNDTTFTAPAQTTNVKDIEILADGKILVLGYGLTQPGIHPILRKLNPDGSEDGSFTPTISGGGTPEEMLVMPDGKILVAGNIDSFGATSVGRILRVNADGTVDSSFNSGGAGSNGSVNDIALRTDGKLIITGGFSNFNGNVVHRVARLNADGSFDNTFTNNGVLTSGAGQDVQLLPDNRIIVGLNNSAFFNSLVRLSADGAFDSTFVVLVTRAGLVRRVVQQPDGKILAAGTFKYANGNVERHSLARFNSDGSLDTAFVPYFNNHDPLPRINAIAVQADGKILVGASNGIVLARLNSDGSQDGTFVSPFPTTSHVWDITALADGKMLVAGDMTIGTAPFRFTRLNNNGTRDLTFNPPQPGNRVHKIYLQPDGRMFVAGIFGTIADIAMRDKIARYNTDGNLDNTFIPNSSGSAGLLDLAVQPDGKVIAVGSGSFRLNADGTRDNSFTLTSNGEISAVELLPDGKILIGGGFSILNGLAKNGIARLNSNGSVDLTFTAYTNKTVNDLQIQTDGKILLGGLFTQVNGISNVRVARLLYEATPSRTFFDYDGDGKADISVFRPSENRWYVFKSSDSTVTQTVFAIAGDVPVPADYDGDLKTDVAIYRPSNGAWWYQSSLNGAQINVNWGGEAGDIPRPSDFDGDGKTDFIIFRPTNSTWYRITSTGTVSNVAFGLSGDKPVRGDFDGDGKSDVAIYRPSTGDWWYQSSINNAQLAVRWGISTDIPAPADFDGDGKTDFAVYRPSTGVWYVINSSNGSFLIGPFGTPEDKPVPADYDGDGKAELAVFRPSTGIWYQLRTNGGFFAMQFGIGTDTPTPNVFVP